jgi:predicted ATPase
VHSAAEAMLAAIASIFILDPVPHQMREYVPQKDSHLRRAADNLSATLARLTEEPESREALLSMTRSLSEAQVSKLSSVSSELGDVMATIDEKIGGEVRAIPARLMSDGTLRFLAIAAALLDVEDVRSAETDEAQRLLVIEEIENGLHPSQASLLIGRLKEAADERGVRTVATTHSPAILDSLEGSQHEDVVVTSRDAEGWSKVTRLVDFPNYFEVASRSSLGFAAVEDRLRPGKNPGPRPLRSLSEIF